MRFFNVWTPFMNIETKAFDIKTDITESMPPGTVHAVVSVFKNEDSYADVMVKGAFAKAIKDGKAKGNLPPGVWSHDWMRPVAKTVDAYETDEGLNVIGQFNLETQDGRDAYSNVKNGLFTEYSFGFRRVKEDEKDGITYVKEVEWYEWSPVLVGANRQTRTVAVKQYDTDDFISYADIEQRLRDVGLAQKAAKIWVVGLKALRQRDVEEAQSPEPTTEQSAEPAPETEAESPPEEPPTPITEPAEEKTEQPPIEAVVVVSDAPVVVKADSRAVSARYANFLTLQARLIGRA